MSTAAHDYTERRATHRVRATLLLTLLTTAVAACATPGATFRSGVGDALLEHPPYYAGARVPDDTARIAHLPIAYQRGGMQASIFDPEGGSGTPIAELLAAMNASLDSLGLTVRLSGAVRGTPPDVRFGCETDPGGPSDECKTRDANQALGRGREYMVLAVGRPSREWVDATGALLDSARVAHTLVITLEVANYLPRQRGWRGDKEVELGTGYTVRLPWLTSLETPVTVLQLTGALVGRDGRAVRIGAEGMLARRTPLVVSALGAQALLTDEDVEQLRTARRDELPGRPLVWEVALRNLVDQLTGHPAVAQR